MTTHLGRRRSSRRPGRSSIATPQQRGLVLRVEASGRKSWFARYSLAGRDRRFRVGTYPGDDARVARASGASHALGQAGGGDDPQVEREKLRAGDTVAVALRTWLDDVKLGPAARWKGGLEGGARLLDERKRGDERAALAGTARSFIPHIRALERDLGSTRLVELTQNVVEHFVSAPITPATRNRRLTALKLFLNWAKRKGLVESDPTSVLGKEREAERSRVLSDAELRSLVRGFDATRYGRTLRLLALTGLRRDEVLGAQWSWVDTNAGIMTIPLEAEKAGAMRGEQRLVPLSETAVALLKAQREAVMAQGLRASPFVFPTTTGERPHPDALKPVLYRLKGLRSNGQPASTSKHAKAREAVLPDDVTIHDLRRTVGHRLLTQVKAAPWVIDHVILGHVRPKVVRTYQPELPLDDAREALTKWAKLLDDIVRAEERALILDTPARQRESHSTMMRSTTPRP